MLRRKILALLTDAAFLLPMSQPTPDRGCGAGEGMNDSALPHSSHGTQDTDRVIVALTAASVAFRL